MASWQISFDGKITTQLAEIASVSKNEYRIRSVEQQKVFEQSHYFHFDILRFLAPRFCGSYGLVFRVGALKSPFLKGDLGGFSTACEIPPAPLCQRGAQESESIH